MVSESNYTSLFFSIIYAPKKITLRCHLTAEMDGEGGSADLLTYFLIYLLTCSGGHGLQYTNFAMYLWQ